MPFTQDEIADISSCKAALHKQFDMIMFNFPNLPWNNMFLSGGAIASTIQGEYVNDYDIYCMSPSTNQLVQKILEEEYSHLIKDVDPKYHAVMGKNGKMITHNAITMIDGAQFIICVDGDAKTIKSSFDYVHCCPHYNIISNELFISKKQYQVIKYKQLVVNNQIAINGYRKQKFIDRGYTVWVNI